MAVSNYEIMRDRMRGEFIKYDVSEKVRRFGLKEDETYLHIRFAGRMYRIRKADGVVEALEGDRTWEADYNESMTIYDVLGYSKPDCTLSGRFCPISSLQGAVTTSGGPGGGLFQRSADGMNGRLKVLRQACLRFGKEVKLAGDVAVELEAFSFLPVILQFWEGDEEFSASLKFMFDENILSYMHYETVFFMMSHLIRRIEEIMQEIENI